MACLSARSLGRESAPGALVATKRVKVYFPLDWSESPARRSRSGPAWERWGGDAARGGGQATLQPVASEQTRAEHLGGAHTETPEEGIVTGVARGLSLLLALRSFWLTVRLRCLRLSVLSPFPASLPPSPPHHFPSVSSPFPFASPSVPGKDKLP